MDPVEEFRTVEDNKCLKDEVAVHCSLGECKYEGDIHKYIDYSYQCVKTESYFASKDWIPLCQLGDSGLLSKLK